MAERGILSTLEKLMKGLIKITFSKPRVGQSYGAEIVKDVSNSLITVRRNPFNTSEVLESQYSVGRLGPFYILERNVVFFMGEHSRDYNQNHQLLSGVMQ